MEHFLKLKSCNFTSIKKYKTVTLTNGNYIGSQQPHVESGLLRSRSYRKMQRRMWGPADFKEVVLTPGVAEAVQLRGHLIRNNPEKIKGAHL